MNTWSPREREALHRLACFGHLNTSQLEAHMFDGSTLKPHSAEVKARMVLDRLRERGLIASTTRLVGGPGGGSARLVWHLTDAGRRRAAELDPMHRERRPPPRSTVFIEHCLMAADVAIAFRKAAHAHPGHDLVEWASERDAAERLGGSAVVPDGLFVYATDKLEIHACVEADLGTERPARFAGKIGAYLDVYRSGRWRAHLPRWPLVLTVTDTTARATALRRATEDVLRAARDAGRLARTTEFDFAALADVRGPNGPLGAIWQVAGRPGLHRFVPADDEGSSPDSAGPSTTDPGPDAA